MPHGDQPTCILQLAQVEIERRYAAVLHHTVKRMMEGVGRIVSQLLAQPPPDGSPISSMAEPIVSILLSSSYAAIASNKSPQSIEN